MYSHRTSSSDQRLVHRRAGREVERVQRLRRREPGRLQPPLGRPPLPLDQLQLAQLQQEPEVVDVLGGARAGRHLLALGRHRRQLQRLEVVLQQHRALGLGLLHGVTPADQARVGGQVGRPARDHPPGAGGRRGRTAPTGRSAPVLQDQPHRVGVGRPQLQRLLDGPRSARPRSPVSSSRRTWMNCRVPGPPSSASSRRRRTPKQTGSSQPSSGRGEVQRPGLALQQGQVVDRVEDRPARGPSTGGGWPPRRSPTTIRTSSTVPTTVTRVVGVPRRHRVVVGVEADQRQRVGRRLGSTRRGLERPRPAAAATPPGPRPAARPWSPACPAPPRQVLPARRGQVGRSARPGRRRAGTGTRKLRRA